MVAPQDVIIGGKFQLKRQLARGGMGVIWEACHLQLDTAVALKFMDPALTSSATARARFEREAKTLAQLRSPHVVRIYDYGMDGDTPYMVMELLQGESLAARLHRERRLGLEAARALLEPVCNALRCLHEAGLVHRDIKPANIFLDRRGGEQAVKLVDFGIVKAVCRRGDDKITRSRSIVGSPYYMSPEQVREPSSIDHRSDLWSLGLTLFEALTGRMPFKAQHPEGALLAICMDPIPAASHLAPGLGPEVDRFFAKALSREPSQRFQSAAELWAAFAALEAKDGAQAASQGDTGGANPDGTLVDPCGTTADVIGALPGVTGSSTMSDGPATFRQTTPLSRTATPVPVARTPPPEANRVPCHVLAARTAAVVVLGAAIASAPSWLRIVTTAWGAPAPFRGSGEQDFETCAQIRAAHPDAADGEYPLTIAGRKVTGYCQGMSAQPAEYLTLARTSGAFNYSHYGEGTSTSPGGNTTHYKRVRLHCEDLSIEPADFTFAESEGWYTAADGKHRFASYGTACDCRGRGALTGRANIDLTGTPFALAPGALGPIGDSPEGATTVEANGQIVHMTGGGQCGGMGPLAARIKLEWAKK